MSAQHRQWVEEQAARRVNVLLAVAAGGHPEAMAAADHINLIMETMNCATWRAGDITAESRAWQEANAQLATLAPSVRALLRLRTHTEEIAE